MGAFAFLAWVALRSQKTHPLSERAFGQQQQQQQQQQQGQPPPSPKPCSPYSAVAPPACRIGRGSGRPNSRQLSHLRCFHKALQSLHVGTGYRMRNQKQVRGGGCAGRHLRDDTQPKPGGTAVEGHCSGGCCRHDGWAREWCAFPKSPPPTRGARRFMPAFPPFPARQRANLRAVPTASQACVSRTARGLVVARVRAAPSI